MPIDFEELQGSPRISFDDSGSLNAYREFRLSVWNDWVDFVNEIYGIVRQVGGTGYAAKKRAHFPGIENLLASGVDVEAFDPGCPDGNTTLASVSSGMNTYSGGARIKVFYRNRDLTPANAPSLIVGDTYITWDEDFGVEVQMTPGRAWRQGPSPSDKKVQSDVMVPIKIPVKQHRVTWSNVARPPHGAIAELYGKINSNSGANFFRGVPVGCLMFDGANIQTAFQTDGSERYTVSYSFSERTGKMRDGTARAGWNHLWVPEPDGGAADEHWTEVHNAVTDELMFQSGDLSRLFRYE